MSEESNLLLRHGERVFGPVPLGQVRELLAAGTITETDSVREENGPWVLIRDYLEWKEADAAPVSDISELLGKAAPRSDPDPAVKPAAKSPHDPDNIPLAESVREPDRTPDPGLGETREMETPWQPRQGPGGGPGVGSTGGRGGRPKSSAEPTGQASEDVIPLPVVSDARPATPSRPDYSERRSQSTLENIALPEDTDLDAILRAMAAYEQTAPPLKPRGRR